MIWPATYLGDFSAERIVTIGLVPEYADAGEQSRAMHLLVGEAIALDHQDHWVLQTGKVQEGRFVLMGAEIPLDGALSPNVARRIEFADPVLLSRGDLFAVRISPRGLPPPIVGLTLVVEWSVHATRRSPRA